MSGLSIKQRIALELHRQLVLDSAEKHQLRQLFWECTLRCNMKCRHCGSDCRVSSLHPDMPFEDFAKVLRRIKEKYDSHKIMVIVTGGEPLMRKDIEQCGRAIYDMEFPWGIVSNGLLMTPKKIDGLLRSGLHAATISLDGFQAERSVSSVMIDGAISACASIRSDLAQGNIYKDDFIDVWENRYQPY